VADLDVKIGAAHVGDAEVLGLEGGREGGRERGREEGREGGRKR